MINRNKIESCPCSHQFGPWWAWNRRTEGNQIVAVFVFFPKQTGSCRWVLWVCVSVLLVLYHSISGVCCLTVSQANALKLAKQLLIGAAGREKWSAKDGRGKRESDKLV